MGAVRAFSHHVPPVYIWHTGNASVLVSLICCPIVVWGSLTRVILAYLVPFSELMSNILFLFGQAVLITWSSFWSYLLAHWVGHFPLSDWKWWLEDATLDLWRWASRGKKKPGAATVVLVQGSRAQHCWETVARLPWLPVTHRSPLFLGVWHHKGQWAGTCKFSFWSPTLWSPQDSTVHITLGAILCLHHNHILGCWAESLNLAEGCCHSVTWVWTHRTVILTWTSPILCCLLPGWTWNLVDGCRHKGHCLSHLGCWNIISEFPELVLNKDPPAQDHLRL